MSITDKVENILLGGWGQRAAIGFLFGFLDYITPEVVYDYITENTALFNGVCDEDWGKWKNLAKRAGIEEILTRQWVIAEFRKRRLDLLQVVFNTENGLAWLDTQISELRKKLCDS